MAQNVFQSSLNDVCRRYLVGNAPIAPAERFSMAAAFNEQRAMLFEQIMLFDKITFTVHGENILIPMLIRFLGEKALEELIEQDAIAFVLWTPFVGFVTQNIPGLVGLVHGNLDSPAHVDPQQSLELGLKWLPEPLSYRAKKRLVKKALPLYIDNPKPYLSGNAVEVVKSAFLSGRYKQFGLNPEGKEKLDNLSKDERKTLSKCAEDLLQYRYLMENRMTSFSEYKFFSPLWDSIDRFRLAFNITSGFNQIAAVESFPNLRALSFEINAPLAHLPRLRQSRNASRFRQWLETSAATSVDQDIAKDYIDAIANRKGLFDSAPAKFIKSIALASVGVVLGGLVGGVEGAAIGAAAAPTVSHMAVDGLTHLGLDLVDSFALDAIAHGWSPRMFFDDLRRFRAKHADADRVAIAM